MSISRDQLKAIRVSLDAALAAVAKEHGLKSFKAGNCTFSPEGSFVFKVEGVAADGASKDEQLYDILRSSNPTLWPERGTDAARMIYSGEPIELFGANSTLSKVIYRRVSDGKNFLSNKEQFRMFLERRASASTGSKVASR